MQTNDEARSRVLPDFIKQIADELGIECRTYSDDWVIELSQGDQTRRIIANRFDINPSASAGIAMDKVATYSLLKARDIPAVEHYLVRTNLARYSSLDDIEYEDVVIKPLMGSGGKEVRRLGSKQAAWEYMSQSGIEEWAVSPYIAIEQEIRFVVLDGEILLSYEKVLADRSRDINLFNLKHGAKPRDYTADTAMQSLALRAVNAIGLRLAAVDVVNLAAGGSMILEINDGFMMDNYSRLSSDHKKRTYDMYRQVMMEMMR